MSKAKNITKVENYDLDNLKNQLREIGLKLSTKEKQEIADAENIGIATFYVYISGQIKLPALARALKNRGFEMISTNEKAQAKKVNYNLKDNESPVQEHDRLEQITVLENGLRSVIDNHLND